MAIETAIVTGTTPTSISTKSFEVAGFGTPQAAIIQITEANTTNNPASHSGVGIGFTDGTIDTAVAIFAEDNVATSDTERGNYSNACVKLYDTTGIEITGVFSAWATNGITINFTATDTTQAHHIQITLIKGCTNAYVNTKQLTTTGVNDITDPGFKPNLVYFTCTGNSADNSSTTNSILSFGAAHNNSSDVVTQGQVAVSHTTGLATAQIFCVTRNDSCVGQQFNGTQSWAGSAETFDASGFSINTGAASPGNDYIYYLALDTGDTDGVSIDIVDSPTTTGTWSITSPAFTPQSVTLCMTTTSTINTIIAADPVNFALSMFDDTTEACIGIDSDDAIGTTDEQSNYSTTNGIETYEWGGSSHDLMHQASFSSFDANGYSFSFPTYVDGTARKWLSIAIEGVAAGAAGGYTNSLSLMGVG